MEKKQLAGLVSQKPLIKAFGSAKGSTALLTYLNSSKVVVHGNVCLLKNEMFGRVGGPSTILSKMEIYFPQASMNRAQLLIRRSGSSGAMRELAAAAAAVRSWRTTTGDFNSWLTITALL